MSSKLLATAGGSSSSAMAAALGRDNNNSGSSNNHHHQTLSSGGGATASTSAAPSSPSNSSSSSPHLCLRWNNYQSNLTSVFDQLLQNETFVDVTLAADGHAIKAHRMVLSACSPYFQHLFFDNPCQHPIVILKDTRWPELKAIVEYMYRGEISVAQEELSSLLRVAETLKIRGLSELNSDHRRAAAAAADEEEAEAAAQDSHDDDDAMLSPAVPLIHPSRRMTETPTWPIQQQQQQLSMVQPTPSSFAADEEDSETPTPSPSPAVPTQQQQQPTQQQSAGRANKRRRMSGSESPAPATSPAAASTPGMHHQDEASMDHHDTPLSLVGHQHHHHQQQQQQQQQHSPISTAAAAVAAAAAAAAAMAPMSQAPPTLSQHLHSDDLDIKPGIAELIREEERARMLEGTHPWLTASPSVLSADTYQYQLQALWQKAWATGQGVMQNLRFRERGPFKTWRPETMAEAIMAVLREGLSLSQAARKFDIPYPTFVLYANRVNNMLGPSADGGSELRPKGRGRPQRILTGSWPEDHVHGVIRAVVFRDPSSLPRHIDREDASKLTANRTTAGAASISRLMGHHPTPTSIQSELGGNGSGMRSLIQSAISNGNGQTNHEFAQPSSSSSSSSNISGTFSHGGGGSLMTAGPNYPSMRSAAGPSSSSSSGTMNNVNNSLMAELMASANSLNNGASLPCGMAGSSCGTAGLTSSSLFNVLQQEVAEETRLAALNAMTQRLMTSLEAESFGLGGPMQMVQQMNCNQQRSIGNNSAAVAAAAALEAAAWFGPNGSFSGQLPIVELAGDDITAADDDDDDDSETVQHLNSFRAQNGTASDNNPIHANKQEQVLGE